MDRASKEAFVADFNEKLGRASLAVVTDFRGIDVNSMVQFRKSVAGVDGAEYKVVKNRLALRALEGTDFEGLGELLEGPNGILISYGDVVEAAKKLTEFMDDNEDMELKGGALDGSMLSPDQVKALADLPSKEVLQSMLLGVLQAPSRNFVSLLANANRQIVNVLAAYRDKLEESA